MLTRVLVISTACICIAAAPIWSPQKAIAGDTGGIKGKSVATPAAKSLAPRGKQQQKRWTPANFK
jgi:hypothetical protein